MNPSNSPVAITTEKLRKAAQADKVFNDIFHVFAARQRARRMVSVSALAQRMKKEGFNYAKNEYRRFLKFMSSLGLGKLVIDRSGAVRALEGVTVSLQSIGLVACSQGADSFRGLPEKNRFKDLPVSIEDQPRPENKVSLTLTFNINNKMIPIELPSSMSRQDIAELVARLSRGSDKTQ